MQHHAVLGPNGHLIASAWPLGSGRGILMCMGLGVGYIWGFSAVWQIALAISQAQSRHYIDGTSA
jgi:hypothetical protein